MDGERFKQLVHRHRLPFAITAVVAIALLLTAVSMSLYVTSGTASLDLSRPGYTQVRKQVVNPKAETFDSNGPMDPTTIAQFKKMFDMQRKSLDSLGNFSDSSLDDESLQLQAR